MRAGPGRLSTAVAVSALLAGGLAACGGNGADGEADHTPVHPAPVALTVKDAPTPVSIGVIVSLSSRPGQGAQWREAAEGAEVAAHRFRTAGVDVTLHPVDDKGTAKGAAAAVRKLAAEGVSGIVVATSGSHVKGALDAAQSVKMPLLLPYDDASQGLREIAWTTGPSADEADSALARALKGSHLTKPALVDAGGGTPSGFEPVADFGVRPGANAHKPARQIAKSIRNGSVDAVVVTGPAEQQATVVQALQGRKVSAPVLLSPDALSPVFASTLAKDGGSLFGDFTTAGTDAEDPAAMSSDADGDALSAYFAALRATALDPKAKDFFDNQPFATVADAADTRSHDAVVALVDAAAAAHSDKPADVLAQLGDLKLTHADGLAGASLDFGSHEALSGEDVVPLKATSQNPGLRPARGKPKPQLFWFAAPAH